MSFNWESYIQLADSLVSYNQGLDFQEACLRSAMSRSYYGIFCIARNYLIFKNAHIPMINTHRFVIERYQKSSSKMEKKIAMNLNRLRKERNDADYENEISVDRKRVETTVALSKETLKLLRQIEEV